MSGMLALTGIHGSDQPGEVRLSPRSRSTIQSWSHCRNGRGDLQAQAVAHQVGRLGYEFQITQDSRLTGIALAPVQGARRFPARRNSSRNGSPNSSVPRDSGWPAGSADPRCASSSAPTGRAGRQQMQLVEPGETRPDDQRVESGLASRPALSVWPHPSSSPSLRVVFPRW